MEITYSTTDTSISTIGIIGLVLAIIIFLIGLFILTKGNTYINFTRAISGLWFFGYLTFLIGSVAVAYTTPTDQVGSFWILFGCTIGFALVGAILSGCITILGNIALGAASGWSLWSLFSPFVPNSLANLIVSFVLAVIGAVLLLIYKEKIELWASSWIGANLTMFGAIYLIINSIMLSNAKVDINLSALILYIIVVIVTVILFAVSGCIHYRNQNPNSHNEISKQETA